MIWKAFDILLRMIERLRDKSTYWPGLRRSARRSWGGSGLKHELEQGGF